MTAAVRLPVEQNTPEWLEARQHGIGSSDAPVIAGERGSVLELYAIKRGELPAPEPDDVTARLFEWGHRLEPVIADWYSESTGRKLRREARMLQHRDVPWAFASLDRTVVGERRVVEIKSARFGWKPEPGAPVPGRVFAQVQHQLWVTGFEVADVVVLVGGSLPSIHEIGRDDSYIDDLAFLERDFWARVEGGMPPPADGSENARRALAALHPRNDGTMLPQSPVLDEMAVRLREAKWAAKAAAADLDTVENAIRAVIGDADGFDGSWGRITWKRNADGTRTDWKALADDLLPLPDAERLPLIDKWTRPVEGPRVLRAKFEGVSDD